MNLKSSTFIGGFNRFRLMLATGDAYLATALFKTTARVFSKN